MKKCLALFALVLAVSFSPAAEGVKFKVKSATPQPNGTVEYKFIPETTVKGWAANGFTLYDAPGRKVGETYSFGIPDADQPKPQVETVYSFFPTTRQTCPNGKCPNR